MPRATVNAHFVLNLLFSQRRGCQPCVNGSPIPSRAHSMPGVQRLLPLYTGHWPCYHTSQGTPSHPTCRPSRQGVECLAAGDRGRCMAGRRQDRLTHKPRVTRMLSGHQGTSPCPLCSSRTMRARETLSSFPSPREILEAWSSPIFLILPSFSRVFASPGGGGLGMGRAPEMPSLHLSGGT